MKVVEKTVILCEKYTNAAANLIETRSMLLALRSVFFSCKMFADARRQTKPVLGTHPAFSKMQPGLKYVYIFPISFAFPQIELFSRFLQTAS